MFRIASFNCENLFERPKAMNLDSWSDGKPVLDAYREVNELIQKDNYTTATKTKIRDLLVTLEIYTKKGNVIRRNPTLPPKWAWLRKNRGTFDHEPTDTKKSVEIIAGGRGDWIGWIELATEPVNEIGTKTTGRVINDVHADIIAIVEAEDRPSLVRFNKELLGGRYAHMMLVDGNDERGIDVGIMTASSFTIESIHSNVDATDAKGIIFSRDCPQYEVRTPGGTAVQVLINHFKSQSGGGGDKRKRQAAEVRRIVDKLVQDGEHVIVLGDLNEGPRKGNTQADNLADLYNNNSPLVDCYSLPGFDLGNVQGTWDDCGLGHRFDYIFLSKSLVPLVTASGVFRKGLWGGRKTRPDKWDTYPEMTKSVEEASDHAAIYVDLNI